MTSVERSRGVRAIVMAAAVGVAAASAGCQPAGKARPAAGAGGPPVAAGPSTITVPPAETDRYRSAVEISKIRERALDMLLDASRGEYDLTRATSLEALSLAPARLSEVVGPAARDKNPGVRSAAAMMVGRARLKSARSTIEPLLEDPDPRVRASAIFAVNAAGGEADPTPLAGMLMGDRDPRARAHAAFVLGEMGEKSALALLRDAARQTVSRATAAEVRFMQLQIAEAMVKLGDDTQLEVIRAALYPARPEDLEAAALAVQIIGQIKDRGAIDNLIYLTATRDERGNRMPAEIRLGSAQSLARMGLVQGGFIADEFAGHPEPALRAQAAAVYGEIGRPENLAKLDLMMKDADPSVRVTAAAAVVKIASGQGGGRS